MQDLAISLIQANLAWEDVSSNLKMFESRIGEISDSDLILLPEMFNTGFSMNTNLCAEKMDGRTISWMQKLAAKMGTAIAGSIIIEEDKRCYNRFLMVQIDGSIQVYDKRHLFSMGDEHLHFSPGMNQEVFHLNDWKLCPMVCYDLRFPVWSRNTKEFDALLYVANWPQVRISHWDKLLQARAIENQCYVAAVNRVGEDGHGTAHNGHSAVIDFMGEPMISNSGKSIVLEAHLSHEKLSAWRKRFPVAKDADSFDLHL